MKKMLLLLFLFLWVPTFSFATVIYNYSALDDGTGPYAQPETFTLVLGDYLLADAEYSNGDGFLSSSFFNSVSFKVDAVAAGWAPTAFPSQAISASRTVGGSPVFYFNPASFTTDGLHSSGIVLPTHTAFLDVEHIPISSVPEPNTLFLLGFGLLGIVGVNRKKIK
ncbi:MAG: PEP-CTERM sorting domain-containing protein [Desulfobacula sp.]|jgi:hypothetical protein|nr:PEP-CTERM sorting domain-containing protein [Desulfobacula sp.]